MKINKYLVIVVLALPAIFYWEWARQQAESAYSVSSVSMVSAAGKMPSVPKELEFFDSKMKKQSLKDFKGTALLLNFWATWCPPCIEELPSLAALAEKLSKKHGVKTILVSTDENWQVVNSFFKNTPLRKHKGLLKPNQMPFIQFLDPEGRAAREFGTEKYPETYLINAEGLVLKKFIGAQDWESEEVEGWILDALR